MNPLDWEWNGDYWLGVLVGLLIGTLALGRLLWYTLGVRRGARSASFVVAQLMDTYDQDRADRGEGP